MTHAFARTDACRPHFRFAGLRLLVLFVCAVGLSGCDKPRRAISLTKASVFKNGQYDAAVEDFTSQGS
jgi:hypothetical protein